MALRIFVDAVDADYDFSYLTSFSNNVDNTSKPVPLCFPSVSGGGNNIDDAGSFKP